ncbi:MAG: UDP-glucose 4-epimerase GalE [Candidatus Microsaccharimonas sp.]
MNILVTGGAGYIGSHTLVELIEDGHKPIVVDNLINSSSSTLLQIEKITGTHIPFYNLDLRHKEELQKLFSQHNFDAVIHFAGLKAVGESVKDPLSYYNNNVLSTISLLESMLEYNVNKIVFSSSATVYGDPGDVKYAESLTVGQKISNPYGQTKYMSEQIIRDLCAAQPNFEASILRYFNPIGAHESGLIGENPKGIPNNLMPFITQVASGRRKKLSIFGNDYATPDGTCRRDYIHVVDLAKGHVAALNHLKPGVGSYNLGTGQATSVLELVKAFISSTEVDIPYEFTPRRLGDLAEFYADPQKAKKLLGWQAEKSIEDMCQSAWKWETTYLELHPASD